MLKQGILKQTLTEFGKMQLPNFISLIIILCLSIQITLYILVEAHNLSNVSLPLEIISDHTCKL